MENVWVQSAGRNFRPVAPHHATCFFPAAMAKSNTGERAAPRSGDGARPRRVMKARGPCESAVYPRIDGELRRRAAPTSPRRRATPMRPPSPPSLRARRLISRSSGYFQHNVLSSTIFSQLRRTSCIIATARRTHDIGMLKPTSKFATCFNRHHNLLQPASHFATTGVEFCYIAHGFAIFASIGNKKSYIQ